jgi:hypothetical protein
MNNVKAQGDFDLTKLEEIVKAEDVVQIAAKIHEKIDTLKGALDRKVDRNDVEFYLVAVFKNRAHRKEFTDALGLPDNRYVDGKTLQGLLPLRNVGARGPRHMKDFGGVMAVFAVDILFLSTFSMVLRYYSLITGWGGVVVSR